jgi:uncharacterized membrane protein
MKKYVMMAVLVIMTCSMTMAQASREFIRNEIEKHGECRNVAITETNGDLMLYGRNGWAATSCPDDLTEALNELNDNDDYISDVQLTENGSWLILYGSNGFRWNNIPSSLEKEMKDYNRDGEEIYSVTFNDKGDWIVITSDHFSASEGWITDWLKEGEDSFGELWAACVTDDAMVAVYESGYKYHGNVPSDLKDALRKSSIDVFRLKIAGTSWFFADKNGENDYKM